MKRLCILIFALLCPATFLGEALAAPYSLSNVPAYSWYHGCGPTAAASVLGHWDLNGYNNIFDASGWDQVNLTANVQHQISSDAHNAAYDSNPDAGTIPQSKWTSIADWFRTSVNQSYGWSWLSDSDDAFIGYTTYRGYQFDSWHTDRDWNSFVAEINLGNPLMFLVDTNADGSTDHFVPVFGYDQRDDGSLWYACYTTGSESETVQWYPYRKMGNTWGVGYMTFCHPISSPDPVPEPATFLLLGAGLIGLAGHGRKELN